MYSYSECTEPYLLDISNYVGARNLFVGGKMGSDVRIYVERELAEKNLSFTFKYVYMHLNLKSRLALRT